MQVSIHAPARGATCRNRKLPAASNCFDPRAREGRDLIERLRERAATSFDPRAREGRDPREETRHFLQAGFDPRAREGRDRQSPRRRTVRICFDPRAREGRDPVRRLAGPEKEKFRSTRPRGARRLSRSWSST
ncbi:hypothetical protein NB311A_20291 [Nitrobacter sp. Nb-311A]|nr:hypothetical protein NB311A_20291 [Nitrobacter sp. Nb-311A]